MAPALRMTRSIKEKLPIFFFFFFLIYFSLSVLVVVHCLIFCRDVMNILVSRRINSAEAYFEDRL